MSQVVKKKISLNLIGVNGNAFAVLGAFSAQARKEKWKGEEIDKVINAAMTDDYEHLLHVITAHIKKPS